MLRRCDRPIEMWECVIIGNIQQAIAATVKVLHTGSGTARHVTARKERYGTAPCVAFTPDSARLRTVYRAPYPV